MGDVVYFPRAPLPSRGGLEQALLEFHEAVEELRRVCQAYDDARQVYSMAEADEESSISDAMFPPA